MAKLTLDNIGNFTSGTVTTINTNFDRIEAALENTLSRDGSVPNQMTADLDMNDQDLINVKDIHADTGIFDNIVASNIDFEDIIPEMTILRDQTIAAAEDAADSMEFAHDWAVEEENVPVNDGIHTPNFSAYHWAQVAEAAAVATASGVVPFGPFVGNGVQTAFTLPIAPIISGNCVVFVDGVWQDYQARTIAGTTLTFTEAPPLGTTISGVIFTVVEDVLAPAAGSVTSTSLDAGDNVAMRTVLDVYSKAEVDTKDKGVKGANIASAASIDLGAATGDFVDITGTTTITSFGTADAGVERTVRFLAALTLTHNVTSLQLACALDITTFSGLVMRFRSLGAGNWKEVSQTPARGSNANGEYTRFADGTQICRAVLNLGATIAIDVAFLGGFRSGAQTWTFPQPFAVTVPSVSVEPTGITAFGAVISAASLTAPTYCLTAITTQAAAQRNVTCLAVGRWF